MVYMRDIHFNNSTFFFSYEKSSRFGKMGYEEEYLLFLTQIQSDVERKIRRGHDRLQMNKAREQVRF